MAPPSSVTRLVVNLLLLIFMDAIVQPRVTQRSMPEACRALSPVAGVEALLDARAGEHEPPMQPRARQCDALADDYAELPPPEVVVWDLKTMRRRGAFTGHHGQVYCLALSPDGKTLASGGSDGTVRFWRVSPSSP